MIQFAGGRGGNVIHRYLANVIAGFDPRPWEEHAPSFAMPNQQEWAAAIQQVLSHSFPPLSVTHTLTHSHTLSLSLSRARARALCVRLCVCVSVCAARSLAL